MDWVWPELVWFALGCGAMWGFLRILPGRLYRGEFNDLSPTVFYKVPSTVDSPEALSGEGTTEAARIGGANTDAPNTELGVIEGVSPGLEDERRAALIEAIRAREGER